MSQIVPNSDGEFTEPQAVPVVEGIDPATLPQVEPDRFANVETQDSSDAGNLSREQMITLAEVASFRGQSAVALKWKQLSLVKQQGEADAASAERMANILSQDKYPGQPGQIVEKRSDLPWDSDEEFLELQGEHGTVAAELEGLVHDGGAFDDTYFKLSDRLAVLNDRMSTRKDQIRENVAANGQSLESVERASEVQAGLVEKAAQMVASASPAASSAASSAASGSGDTE